MPMVDPLSSSWRQRLLSHSSFCREETGLGKVCDLPRDAQSESIETGLDQSWSTQAASSRGVAHTLSILPGDQCVPPAKRWILNLECFTQGYNSFSPCKTPGWGRGGDGEKKEGLGGGAGEL